MDLATKKLYYNRCKPFEPLSPNDDRNVNLDTLGTPATRVRGFNWVDRIASKIELADGPVLELFTGLPGSGKSTELSRVVDRLADAKGANLLTVFVDAEEFLDLANSVDIPDVIATIVYKTECEILKLEGADEAKALKDGYLKRLWNFLSNTDVTPKEVEFNISDAASLLIEMKSRPTFREQVRKRLASRLTKFLDDARDELTILKQRAINKGRAGIVIIFDSLEKLRGTTTNYDQVLNSAEQLFNNGAPYLRLPVHVIYTVPPALINRAGILQVNFMPMIKLRNSAGARNEVGYEAARTIVYKRIPKKVLPEFLGNDADNRLDILITHSGGYPREIIRLMQAIIAQPELPIPGHALNRITNEIGDTYRILIPKDAYTWLASVAVDHTMALDNISQRQIADLMLSTNVILRYYNEKPWFGLHPAAEAIPGVDSEITKLRAERGLVGG